MKGSLIPSMKAINLTERKTKSELEVTCTIAGECRKLTCQPHGFTLTGHKVEHGY